MHFKSTNKKKQLSEKLHAVQMNQIISDTDIHMKTKKTIHSWILKLPLFWVWWSHSVEENDWQPDDNGTPINQPLAWALFPIPYAAYV